MAVYTIELDGKQYDIEGDRPPTEEEARQAVGEFGEQAQPVQEQPQTIEQGSIDNVQFAKSALLKGLLAGGAAMYAGYQGGIVPASKEIATKEAEKQNVIGTLKGMQKQLGIEKAEPSLIPQRVGKQIARTSTEQKSQIAKTNSEADKFVKFGEDRLKEFDDKVLNAKVEDAGKVLEEAYPKFLKSASPGYQAGLDAIELHLQDQGKQFDTLKFSKDVVEKALNEGLNRGFTDSELAPIRKVLLRVTPETSQTGIMANEKPMSFQEMKGLISGTVAEDPTSKTSILLRSKWIDFLKDNTTDETNAMLTKLQSGYKEFAEARFRYGTLISKSGEFDRSKANKFMLDYFNAKRDDGQKALFEMVSKGNDIVTGVDGIDAKIKNLEALRPQRQKIISEVEGVKQLRRQVLEKLATDTEEKITKLTALQDKAELFNSRLRVIQTQESANLLKQIPNFIRGLARLGSKMGTGLAVLPTILSAVNQGMEGQDLEGMLSTAAGNPIPPPGKERDKFLKDLLKQSVL